MKQKIGRVHRTKAGGLLARNFRGRETTMKTTTFIAVTFLALFLATGVFAQKGSEYDKALQYYDSGNYREAVKLLRSYVKNNPDASAYYRLGYGLYELGKFAEADSYFKQAYLIDPTFSPEPGGTPKKYPHKKIKKWKKRSSAAPAASISKEAPPKKSSVRGHTEEATAA